MKRARFIILVIATALFLMGQSTAPRPAVLNGFCLGVVAAGVSTTYWLSPGGTTSSACTATNTIGNPMPHTCTAKNLYVLANAGSAGSGSAVTVFSGASGGTNTGITCSLDGPVTTCKDITHKVQFTAGTAWSIGVTTDTAGTDTIQSVRASFDCQ